MARRDGDQRPAGPQENVRADDLAGSPVQRGSGGTSTGRPAERRDDLVDDAQRPDGQGVPQDDIARGSTRALDQLGRDADMPISERPVADIRTTPAERPPTQDLPRTIEKPGTGMPREPGNDFPYTRERQPVPGQEQRYPPRPERERPTGQMTDESGEYGPERTWYDGDSETDWNKVNRAPAVRSAAPKRALRPKGMGIPLAAYIVGGAIAVGLGLGVVNRPAVAPAVTPGPATSSASAASAPRTAPAAGDTYEMGPLKVVRDANSTTSRYTIDVFAVPPGRFTWRLDASCGSIAETQLSALVGWSYDNNTKTCPPGPQGPFPGKLTLTFTSARDGKVYTWTAGSETGSYGEKVTIR